MRRMKSEDGFATVFALAILTGLVTFIAATTATAHWVGTHAQASMVADLAAVAAARQGSCAAAASIADSYGAQLNRCVWHEIDVTVEVALPSPTTLSRWSTADVIKASARAGY